VRQAIKAPLPSVGRISVLPDYRRLACGHLFSPEGRRTVVLRVLNEPQSAELCGHRHVTQIFVAAKEKGQGL
jgi:hypothetical protein